MSEITSSTVLRRPADIRYRRIDGEAVVLRQSTAEVLVLNGVGATVLDLADGKRPVDEWIDALAREYGADRETVARDVLEFAGEASAAGLLEPVPAMPATKAGE
ncbi:MAG TPA: PqqD family protein [Thermoanaerobaculia bacterium]|nr:PqqD family protein [Thermoanaerobaculia bacterium]